MQIVNLPRIANLCIWKISNNLYIILCLVITINNILVLQLQPHFRFRNSKQEKISMSLLDRLLKDVLWMSLTKLTAVFPAKRELVQCIARSSLEIGKRVALSFLWGPSIVVSWMVSLKTNKSKSNIAAKSYQKVHAIDHHWFWKICY